METYKIKYYTYTKNPEVFKRCYWGNNRGGDISDEIIKNRNDFVEKYNLSTRKWNRSGRKERTHFEILHNKQKQYVKPSKDYTIYMMTGENQEFRRDHREYYHTKTNPKTLIGVFSMNTSDDDHKLILSTGYEEIPPIYATGQRTYIKIVD